VLQLKDLRGRTAGEKATGRDGKILEELEGLRGGGTWFAGHSPRQGYGGQPEESCRLTKPL